MQTSPDGTNALHYMSPDAQLNGHETHDNIVVKAATDGHSHGMAPNGTFGPAMPGTNAYVNAHIPMAVNGVAMFDPSKRGRTKACYECRKSKRRCVHDEQGNVDPVKASETPVSRGSGPSKKRPLASGENTPIQSKKAKSVSADVGMSPLPVFHQQHDSPEMHLPTSPNDETFQAQMADTRPSELSNGHSYPQNNQLEHHESHEPLDPSLFAYSTANDNSSYGASNYSYPATERPHLYQMQSLEQIASEVLDMNADYQDQNDAQPVSNDAGPHRLPKDSADADGSVDSGVSLPGSENMEHKGDAADMTMEHSAALAAYQVPGQSDSKAMPQPTTEHSAEVINSSAVEAPQNAQNNSINSLPLYRPPAPLSQSPEQSRRLPNGVPNGSPAKPTGH